MNSNGRKSEEFYSVQYRKYVEKKKNIFNTLHVLDMKDLA